MAMYEKNGKRRQISLRISALAETRLKQNASLFDMSSSEYVKAILYRDLAVFGEPLDQRRKSWKKKQKKDRENDE